MQSVSVAHNKTSEYILTPKVVSRESQTNLGQFSGNKLNESFYRSTPIFAKECLLTLRISEPLKKIRFRVLHEFRRWCGVVLIYLAGLNRRDGPEVIRARRAARSQTPTDYDNATPDVLRNFQDSGTLGQAMLRFRAQVVKVSHAVISLSKLQKPAPHSKCLKLGGRRISGQLNQILGSFNIVIERNRLTTYEASLVMSAFWNLIAQRDNKTNQKIATESKNIAEQSRNLTDESKQIAQQSLTIAKSSALIAQQTKRDSSAVKAISLLTMVFLPATYSAFYWYGPSGFGGQIIG
ncbi:hypothetical protein HBH67_216100 [Parastagonospora nodorum]|nr:hypothetical protein HBH67_216100 [Parastagonospora nodorum]